MTDQELETKVRALLDDVNTNQRDTILDMMQPQFVACNAEAQTLELAFPVLAWERNPIGLMQGGVVATALDYAVACLAIAFSTEKPVTVSMQVSYLRGTPIGGTLHVRTRATKLGRTLIHAFAECFEAASPEKTAATANIVYMT